MDDVRRFELAVATWATGGIAPPATVASARDLAVDSGVRVVVLVEGDSDAAALEHLALRRGRHLGAEGVAIVPLGGATSIGRFMTTFIREDLGVRLAGLCDGGEEGYFKRALERARLGSNLSRADMNRLGTSSVASWAPTAAASSTMPRHSSAALISTTCLNRWTAFSPTSEFLALCTLTGWLPVRYDWLAEQGVES